MSGARAACVGAKGRWLCIWEPSVRAIVLAEESNWSLVRNIHGVQRMSGLEAGRLESSAGPGRLLALNAPHVPRCSR